jgi:hypothetical protein
MRLKHITAACIFLLLFLLPDARKTDNKKEAERRDTERKETEKREADRREAAKREAERRAQAAAAAEEEDTGGQSTRYAAALGPIDLATAALRPALDRYGLPAPIWPALLDHGNVGSDVPAGSLPCNETCVGRDSCNVEVPRCLATVPFVASP